MGDPQATSVALRLLPVAAALLASGGILVALGGLRGGPPRRKLLWTAYLTEFGILAVILVPAYVGTGALLVVCLAIAAAATAELFGALRSIGLNPWTRVGLGAGSALLVASTLGGESWLYALLFSVVVPIVLGSGMLRRGSEAASLKSTLATLFGVVYPGVLLAHLLLLERLVGGFGYVVLLFALVEVNDSFALLVGMLVGGPRLWPRISPHKTLAGAAAGLLATIAVSALLGFATPVLPTLPLLGAGLLVAVLGQTGDLVASSIKRQAGIKDFGSLVPAQGGVLDIFDSLVFTAPAFYWYVRSMAPSLGLGA